MPSTPRRTRKPVAPRTPGSGALRLQGLFQNGQWHCDCDPRQPAVRLQVKKKTANTGKWFYTCQLGRPDQCGFFLWDDLAKVRETGALLDNSRTESSVEVPPVTTPIPARPRQRIFSGIPGRYEDPDSEEDDGDELGQAARQSNQGLESNEVVAAAVTSSVDQPQAPVQTRQSRARKQVTFAPFATPPSKRKRDAFEASDGSDGDFGELDSDTERQLAELTERSELSQSQSQTQYGSQGEDRPRDDVKQEAPDAYTTPSAQKTRDVYGGLPTPVSRNTLLIASEERDMKRQRTGTSSAALQDPLSTPTPNRPSDAHAPSSGSQDTRSGDDYDITEEVMGLLTGTQLDEGVRRSVRESLNRFGLRAQGVHRGREMARAALKTKDARIAELQQRVLQLETEKTFERERMKKVKAGLLTLYQED